MTTFLSVILPAAVAVGAGVRLGACASRKRIR